MIKKIPKIFVNRLRAGRKKMEQNQEIVLKKIESLYDKAIAAGQFEILDILRACVLLFVFNILSIEAIFVTTTVFVTFATTGVFGIFVDTHILSVVLFWLLVTSLSFLAIFICNSFFAFWHLRGRLALFPALLLGQIFSAIIVSYSISLISELFFDNQSVTFQKLLLPLFVLFSLTQLFLYVQHKGKIDFQKYRQRMQSSNFQALFPGKLINKIFLLRAQDHYVEISTATVNKLVRMRFGEAVNLMPDDAGMIVHRSFWVAYDAIEKLTENDGKSFVILKSGEKIPVARSKQQGVKNAIGQVQ